MIINRCFSISILTVIFISISGCSSKFEDNKYIFIGDSIVAGWDLEYYFPYLDVVNRGKNGAITSDLESISWSPEMKQTVVISLIGTNDIAYFKGSILSTDTLNEIVSSYKQAILKSFATNFIVISILPRNGTNAAIMNQQIMKLNEKLKNMTKEIPNVVFLDIFNYFIGTDGQLDVNFTVDGIHLNIYGYELLSAKLSEIL